MKSLKKLPTPAQMDKVEADIGIVFTCHDTEDLKRFREQRRAEIAEQKSAQNTNKNTDATR